MHLKSLKRDDREERQTLLQHFDGDNSTSETRRLASKQRYDKRRHTACTQLAHRGRNHMEMATRGCTKGEKGEEKERPLERDAP